MTEFRTPVLGDRDWVRSCLAKSDLRDCAYHFTTLMLWGPSYGEELARLGDQLLLRTRGEEGHAFLFPTGRGDLAEAMEVMEQQAKADGERFRMICVPESGIRRLHELFPGRYFYQPWRDSFDYVYSVDKLADLPGKKLHSKRTHCNRFQEAHPDWQFRPLSRGDFPACWELYCRWREGEHEGSLSQEEQALRFAMEHFEELGLEGGILEEGGRCLAFTMGDILNSDTFCVHFEKAEREVQGAYAMINREFARCVRDRHPTMQYLNREDDLGILGLRRAKLSYDPAFLVEKFVVTHAV